MYQKKFTMDSEKFRNISRSAMLQDEPLKSLELIHKH